MPVELDFAMFVYTKLLLPSQLLFTIIRINRFLRECSAHNLTRSVRSQRALSRGVALPALSLLASSVGSRARPSDRSIHPLHCTAPMIIGPARRIIILVYILAFKVWNTAYGVLINGRGVLWQRRDARLRTASVVIDHANGYTRHPLARTHVRPRHAPVCSCGRY